jgi:hypothetical protein
MSFWQGSAGVLCAQVGAVACPYLPVLVVLVWIVSYAQHVVKPCLELWRHVLLCLSGWSNETGWFGKTALAMGWQLLAQEQPKGCGYETTNGETFELKNKFLPNFFLSSIDRC